jgi:hypothetical protein
MIQAFAPQLAQLVQQAKQAQTNAEAFGASLVPMLPHKVGDVVEYHSGTRFRVASVYFDTKCFSVAGQWQAGFRVIGTVIGASSGHTTRQIVLDLQGQRVTGGTEQFGGATR